MRPNNFLNNGINNIVNNGINNLQNKFAQMNLNNGIKNHQRGFSFDHNSNNNNFSQNKINSNVGNSNNNRKRPESTPPLVIKKNHANGIVNIGASCYMNATIQCLAHVENLTKHFLKHKNIEKIISNKYKCKLSNSFLKVLQNLWLNNKIKYYSPDDFKNIISEMNPLFAGIQANDSKDLILFLMETIHNELNTAQNINPPNQTLNQYDYEATFKLFSNYIKNNYRSVISNLFYGMYNSMMKCLNCNIITHNIQCYNILIFPLEEVRKYKNRMQNMVDIIECFEYYQKEDYMIGQNQIYCNNCHIMANSVNISKLIIAPNVLVINLNRGKGLQFNIKIKFGEFLDIKNFVYYKDKSPTFYELIGIVTHFGPSSMGGHFIAFCKSFVDQNWYKYNDAQVDVSSFQEASITGVPYILFYSMIKK